VETIVGAFRGKVLKKDGGIDLQNGWDIKKQVGGRLHRRGRTGRTQEQIKGGSTKVQKLMRKHLVKKNQ